MYFRLSQAHFSPGYDLGQCEGLSPGRSHRPEPVHRLRQLRQDLSRLGDYCGKRVRGKKKMAKELLDKACTHVKGLYSKKKDARFDADLLMTLENGKPKFHLEFPKRKH